MKPLPHSTPPAASPPSHLGLLATAGVFGGFLLGFALGAVRGGGFYSSPRASAASSSGQTHGSTPAGVQRATDEGLERRTRAIGAYLAASSAHSTAQQRRLARMALQELRAEDLPWAMAAAVHRPTHTHQLLPPLVARWAELDPAAAAAYLSQHERTLGTSVHDCWRALGVRWAERDPAAARDWAATLADPFPRAIAMDAVLAGHATSDPATALRWLNTLPPSSYRLRYFAFFDRWLRHDPVAALREISSRPTGDPVRSLEESCLHMWAIFDPRAALTWCAQLSPGGNHQRWRMGCWTAWCKQDATAVLAALSLEPDPAIRSQVQQTALAELATVNREEAERLISQLTPGPQQADAWMAAAERIRSLDLPRAVAWSLRGGPEGPESILHRPWDPTPMDVETQLDLIEQHFALSDPRREQLMNSAIALGMSSKRSDLEKLLDRPGLSSTAQWSILSAMSELDPMAALARIAPPESLSPDDLTSYRSFLATLSTTHPEIAAQRYLTLPREDQVNVQRFGTASTVEQIMTNWMQRDFAQAQRWADSLPEPAEAYRSLGEYQGREHDAVVTAWVESIPAGPAREAALEGVIAERSRVDPASAPLFVALLTDPNRRRDASRSLYSEWNNIDPSAAEAWHQQFQP